MRPCQSDEPVRFIRYAFYPLMFIFMLSYAFYEVAKPAAQFGSDYGYYLLSLVGIMLGVEFIHPLRTEWRMTKRSFFRRDLPYMLFGSVTIFAVNYLNGIIILHFGLHPITSHTHLPLMPAVIMALLIPDLIWYWVHRWSHEGRGPFGRWLWRMHLAHHLPPQVYLLMHAVAHPINTAIVRIILTVPLFLLGFSAEALFIANLVVGLQGFFSHFNVDIRTGWLNYLLMGTELHRYHHSADPHEGKNYAAVISLWDLIFGTFQYRPGIAPQRLGVSDPARYPNDTEIVQTLLWPLRMR